MTPQQIRGWRWYDEVEPFGSRRDNYHAAIVAKAVLDASGATKQGGGGFTYEDFMLKFEAAQPKRRQTDAEQASILNIIFQTQAAASLEEKRHR